jgi:hypothetical protein
MPNYVAEYCSAIVSHIGVLVVVSLASMLLVICPAAVHAVSAFGRSSSSILWDGKGGSL